MTPTVLRPIGLVVLLGSAAAADTADLPFATPTGWSRDDTAATIVARHSSKVEHFAGAGAVGSGASVFRAADGAASLIFTTVEVAAPPSLGMAVRAELDHWASSAGIGEAAPWQERVDGRQRYVEATVEHLDAELGTTKMARVLIAATPTRVYLRGLECLWRSDAAQHQAACRDALASLAVPGAVAERVDITIGPRVELPTRSSSDGPRLSDASGSKLPPMTVSTPPRTPRREPVYLGAGLLLIALVLWLRWQRKKEDAAANHEESPGE